MVRKKQKKPFDVQVQSLYHRQVRRRTSPDERTYSLRKRKKKVLTRELASTLDRTRTSNREAVLVVHFVATSLGHNTDEFSLSRETIRRSREHHRAEVAKELKATLHLVPLVVHWDGNVVFDFSVGKVERVVIISGDGVDKLLDVPKLPDGTGRAQENAVLDAVADWGLADRVTGFGFGVSSGVCVLNEQDLHRRLPNLACRLPLSHDGTGGREGLHRMYWSHLWTRHSAVLAPEGALAMHAFAPTSSVPSPAKTSRNHFLSHGMT